MSKGSRSCTSTAPGPASRPPVAGHERETGRMCGYGEGAALEVSLVTVPAGPRASAAYLKRCVNEHRCQRVAQDHTDGFVA